MELSHTPPRGGPTRPPGPRRVRHDDLRPQPRQYHVWLGGADAALGLALVYGGAAQLLAGMWEFVRKNTFGAVAFTSFGAFWIAYYVLVIVVLPGVKVPAVAASRRGLPARLDHLHRLHDHRLVAGVRRGGGWCSSS